MGSEKPEIVFDFLLILPGTGRRSVGSSGTVEMEYVGNLVRDLLGGARRIASGSRDDEVRESLVG